MWFPAAQQQSIKHVQCLCIVTWPHISWVCHRKPPGRAGLLHFGKGLPHDADLCSCCSTRPQPSNNPPTPDMYCLGGYGKRTSLCKLICDELTVSFPKNRRPICHSRWAVSRLSLMLGDPQRFEQDWDIFDDKGYFRWLWIWDITRK